MSKIDDLLDELKEDANSFAEEMREKYTKKLREIAEEEIRDLFDTLKAKL